MRVCARARAHSCLRLRLRLRLRGARVAAPCESVGGVRDALLAWDGPLALHHHVVPTDSRVQAYTARSSYTHGPRSIFRTFSAMSTIWGVGAGGSQQTE